MSVYWYPINLKTAEPIGPKFFEEPYVTTGKVYGCSNLQKLASNKIRFSLNFKKPRNFFLRNRQFFVFLLQCYKEKMFTIEIQF